MEKNYIYQTNKGTKSFNIKSGYLSKTSMARLPKWLHFLVNEKAIIHMLQYLVTTYHCCITNILGQKSTP